MTIAVMSDLHDNVAAWDAMRQVLARDKMDVLINAGDTVAPAMLEHMAKSFPGTIHTIFGNNADRELEMEVVKSLTNVHHYGDQAELNLDGRQIAVVHEPDRATPLISSGNYDLVIHGHTHLKRWEKKGMTFVLNPGTAGGMFQYPSFAYVDLTSMSCSFVDTVLTPNA